MLDRLVDHLLGGGDRAEVDVHIRLLEAFGARSTERHADDVDSVIAELTPHGLREHLPEGLRTRIGCFEGLTRHPRQGSDDHDGSGSAITHGTPVAVDQSCRHQRVQRDDGFDVAQVLVEEPRVLTRPHGTRVEDQGSDLDVVGDRTKALDDVRHRDVERDGPHVTAALPQCARRRLQWFRSAGHEDDPDAAVHQGGPPRRADSLGAAGDDRPGTVPVGEAGCRIHVRHRHPHWVARAVLGRDPHDSRELD